MGRHTRFWFAHISHKRERGWGIVPAALIVTPKWLFEWRVWQESDLRLTHLKLGWNRTSSWRPVRLVLYCQGLRQLTVANEPAVGPSPLLPPQAISHHARLR